ncbi:MAG: hypothetical protein IIA05_08035 [Proteobacteria bacterium]|nr:hypothetical protein [Pseudomonadota bacterium]
MPKRHCLSEDTREKLIDLLGLDPSVNLNDQEKAARAITQVEEVLGHYKQHLKDLQSLPRARARGRPKKEVLQKVIGELRRTFRQHVSEIDNIRKITGAISNLSPAENEEREFIHFALKDANIRHPNRKKIRRSYNKQGTPLADRNKVIEKIEAEAERRAKNSSKTEMCPRIRQILKYFRAS